MVVRGEIEEDSSTNLLQRLGRDHGGDSMPEAGSGDTCEIELSLGLSLNGGFGVQQKEKGLIRSSSISSFLIFPIEHDVPLTRTCSLPVETGEERRKRKEIESFKRMETKRKRLEKKVAKDQKDEIFDDYLGKLLNCNSKESQIFNGKIDGVVVNGKVGRWEMTGKVVNGGSRPASQGSIGSQASSSSSVLDFESKPMQGVDMPVLGNCTLGKSPSTTMMSASNHANQKASTTTNIMREGDEPSKKKKSCRANGVSEKSERSMMEEMPYVSTKGEGPNGRRIEGFLYNYRKGEEVRIVCVCHGQFLTPAEFVKHAGGGDVAYPLRHIVVNPSTALL